MALQLDLADDRAYIDMPDWSPYIDAETLKALGEFVCEAKDKDEASRESWMAELSTWNKLAQQVIEEKSQPWPKAANVKFPMLTNAALAFHARAQQELMKDERIVKGKIIGRDLDGKKAARARRVSDFMSMQMLYKMDTWQEDMDRLLYVLPLVGTVFKKTYWSPDGLPVSDLILPEDLVVNYYATNWERARKTHILFKSTNEVEELMRGGFYRTVNLPAPAQPDADDFNPEGAEEVGESVFMDGDEPYTLFETHMWWDLDGDGYEEPYIVTVEAETEEVLAVTPRFGTDRIVRDEDDRIVRIHSLEYITRFTFFPSVDSNIYGVGFGKLLGPLNAATNSIINQLLNAATLATMPSGFFGRGIRLARGGRMRFRPGEWKAMQATGEDLQKNIVPLPVKEPSAVMFNLLGLLVQAGERTSSVAEVMQGKNPGQNQPFSTTQTVLEQGMQVFLGIYRRLYRQLTKEYRLLFRLNGMFLSDDAYNELLDEEGEHDPVTDFDPNGLDVVPEADPNLATGIKKQMRLQGILQAEQAGVTINQEYKMRLILEALEEPDVEKVLAKNPPPPSKEQLEHQRWEAEHKLAVEQFQWDMEREKFEPVKDVAQAIALIAKAKAEGNEAGLKEAEFGLQSAMKRMEMLQKREEHTMNLQGKSAEQNMKLQGKAAETQMSLEGKNAEHSINLQGKAMGNAIDLQGKAQQNELKAEEMREKIEAQRRANRQSNTDSGGNR
jgi:chaperonin GroES